MLKPLTQQQLDNIIDTATRAFADEGFSGSGIGRIARASHVSVGVIYKYYADKEALFTACVEKALDYLDRVFADTLEKGGSLRDMLEDLIARSQAAVREHPEYFRLYHQITLASSSGKMAVMIEGRSAALYSSLLRKAMESGDARSDMDPSMFAFFFDNLMMMLHFSYTSDYYEDRFRIYCGSDITKRDEEVRAQMMKFLTGAMGLKEG